MKEIEERVEVLTVRQAGDRLDVYVAGNSDLSRRVAHTQISECMQPWCQDGDAHSISGFC